MVGSLRSSRHIPIRRECRVLHCPPAKTAPASRGLHRAHIELIERLAGPGWKGIEGVRVVIENGSGTGIAEIGWDAGGTLGGPRTPSEVVYVDFLGSPSAG